MSKGRRWKHENTGLNVGCRKGIRRGTWERAGLQLLSGTEVSTCAAACGGPDDVGLEERSDRVCPGLESHLGGVRWAGAADRAGSSLSQATARPKLKSEKRALPPINFQAMFSLILNSHFCGLKTYLHWLAFFPYNKICIILFTVLTILGFMALRPFLFCAAITIHPQSFFRLPQLTLWPH